MIYGIRTPNADSLALQTLSYRCMGAPGQDEDKPLASDEIPRSLWRKCVECKSPVDDLDKMICDYCERTMDEADTRYLDDPRRGQAKHINRERG